MSEAAWSSSWPITNATWSTSSSNTGKKWLCTILWKWQASNQYWNQRKIRERTVFCYPGLARNCVLNSPFPRKALVAFSLFSKRAFFHRFLEGFHQTPHGACDGLMLGKPESKGAAPQSLCISCKDYQPRDALCLPAQQRCARVTQQR